MRVRALGLSLGVLAAGGCLQAPRYSCSSDEVCVLNNIAGMCDVPSGTCLYPAPDCESDLRDAHGNCFTSGTGATDDPTSETIAESTMSTTEPDDTSTTNTDDSTPMESTVSGSLSCTGTGDNITDDGVVGASSVFPGFPPILSADGDLSTSWFSRGEADEPIAYTWTLSEDRCIYRITIIGNRLHANPTFREGFGFDAVTVKVVDASDAVVFETERVLEGTPDPDVDLVTGGVAGSRIVLELAGPESPDSAGFSELEVRGDP